MSDENIPPTDGPSTPPSPPPPPPAYGTPPPPPPPPGAPAAGAPYAEWPQRALAYLIDLAPVIGIVIVEQILFAIMPGVIDLLVALVSVVAILGWVVYNYGIQQGASGYTLGKGIVGIKLISEETGQPIGTGMAVARYFVHILDAIPCYIGFLWPLWDEKKQTFADKVLKQIVVTAEKKSFPTA
jgi:uncharacterized RDD family membrane protein YckC